MLQLFFLKKNYWLWVQTQENTILPIVGGSRLEAHVLRRSLDLHLKTREIMNAELEAAIPAIPMTQLIIVPAPVMDMGADATTLRQGMDTTMDPISEDERTAKVHVYQTPLASNVGKDIRDIDDSRYNQRSNVNMTSLLYT